jgi:hypothetical protein
VLHNDSKLLSGRHRPLQVTHLTWSLRCSAEVTAARRARLVQQACRQPSNARTMARSPQRERSSRSLRRCALRSAAAPCQAHSTAPAVAAVRQRASAAAQLSAHRERLVASDQAVQQACASFGSSPMNGPRQCVSCRATELPWRCGARSTGRHRAQHPVWFLGEG